MHLPWPFSIISIARMMLLFNNTLEGQRLTESNSDSIEWRTTSIVSTSQSCIALSDKRLASWVRIAAKVQTCKYLLPSSYFEADKKTDAIVNFFDQFFQMQKAEDRDICASCSYYCSQVARENNPDFSLSLWHWTHRTLRTGTWSDNLYL